MPDVRIEYKVDATQIEKAKKALELLNKEGGLTQQEIDELTKNFKNLNDTLDKNNKKLGGIRAQFGQVAEGMEEMGPAGQAAAGGIARVTQAFKALFANPIVLTLAAIVGALTTLGLAFLQTQRGIDTVEKAQARLNAMWSVARQRLNELTGATKEHEKAQQESNKGLNNFQKLVITILKDLGDLFPSMTRLADDMLEAGNRAAQLAVDTGELEKQMSENAITIAENNRVIQQNLLITRDMETTHEARMQALRESNELELDNLRIRKEEMEETIRLEKERQEVLEPGLELDSSKIKLNELLTQQIELETFALAKQRELKNRLNTEESMFRAQEKTDRQTNITLMQQEQALQQQLVQGEISDMQRLLNARMMFTALTATNDDEKYKAELKRITQHYLNLESEAKGNKTRLLAIEQEFINEKAALDQEYLDNKVENERIAAEELKAINQEVFETEQSITSARIGFAQAITAGIRGIVSEGSALQKALLVFEKALAIVDIQQKLTATITGISLAKAAILPVVPPKGTVNPNYIPAQLALDKQLVLAKVSAGLGIAAIIASTIPEFGGEFHTGGLVKGKRGDVPIMAKSGEFVLREEAVKKYGLPTIEALNKMTINQQAINDVSIKNLDDLPVNHFHWDERGYHKYSTRRGNRVNYINRKYLP